ncbi:MAG: cold shock domain-containing protein [Hyphomicrobiales bacterium]|nr:cold shock domain-containing protein [Hyphomicrobiales bacterium]
MSKGRDFRGPRKRGFDDDGPMNDYAPRQNHRGAPRQFGGAPAGGGGFPDMMASAPSTPPVDATVKWFKADKGFGFVELANGTGDAFLHINAVQQAGYDALPPGAKLKVQVATGQKGQQVTRVLEADLSTAQETRPPRSGGFGDSPRPPRRAAPDPSTATSVQGKVKWFDETKGFGFVQPNDGGKDIFIHISVLNSSGVQRLAEGQPVTMQVVEAPKGREAISIQA